MKWKRTKKKKKTTLVAVWRKRNTNKKQKAQKKNNTVKVEVPTLKRNFHLFWSNLLESNP